MHYHLREIIFSTYNKVCMFSLFLLILHIFFIAFLKSVKVFGSLDGIESLWIIYLTFSQIYESFFSILQYQSWKRFLFVLIPTC